MKAAAMDSKVMNPASPTASANTAGLKTADKTTEPPTADLKAAEAEGTSETKLNTRAFRRELSKSDNYHRRSFGRKEEIAEDLAESYTSDLIQKIRSNNNELQCGSVTIQLAEAFGFCWGVERAVAMAYETRKQFQNRRIWITNEIIHNPSVNKNLRDMDVYFVQVVDGQKDFSGVGDGEVVILPAFGASVQEMKLLNDRGAIIVDTTCPWVSKVWNSVEKHKKDGHTSIVHGKYKHEETIATLSFADTYLVVLNLEEAQYVCDYILHGGDKHEFLEKFKNAHSPGFDPEVDLVRVGVANQTTMLKGETEAIGKLVERTMMQKHGTDKLNEHFMSFNTICDATQERQDAMYGLVKAEKPANLMLVIGGYNSSNTTHLQEIGIDKGFVSFHVDSAECLIDAKTISHKPLEGEITTTTDWLPAGPLVVGITSGASTPDKIVEQTILRLLELKGESL
ncbi:MAG: 4-hydroxy-3-methylbut-2-enyl diphosphate reductase [Cyanobacteria bacterium P01_C01_bin.89]